MSLASSIAAPNSLCVRTQTFRFIWPEIEILRELKWKAKRTLIEWIGSAFGNAKIRCIFEELISDNVWPWAMFEIDTETFQRIHLIGLDGDYMKDTSLSVNTKLNAIAPFNKRKHSLSICLCSPSSPHCISHRVAVRYLYECTSKHNDIIKMIEFRFN